MSGINKKGVRNKILFRDLLPRAAHCETFEELFAEARTYNLAHNKPPLSEAEVRATSRSIWRYREEGRLMLGSLYLIVTHAEFDALCKVLNGHLGVILLVYLRRKLGAPKHPIAVSPGGISDARGIPKMRAPKTVRKARRALEAVGILECVRSHRPDRHGKHEPAQYILKPPQE